MRIGVLIDLSGSVTRPQWTRAAELAAAHVNSGAERADMSELFFELAVSDSSNSPDIAAARAVELRSQGIKALVTDTTEDAIAVLRTIYDSNADNDVAMPTVCMACTAPSLFNVESTRADMAGRLAIQNVDRWGFRTVADTRPEAVALLNAYLDDLGNRGDTNGDGQQKIAMLVVITSDGNDLADGLIRARDAAFPGIVIERIRHEGEIDVESHDWNQDVIEMTNDRNEEVLGRPDGRPDALMEATFPLFAASMSRAYLEAGRVVRNIPFLHHHGWRNDQILVKLGAFDLEGEIGISHAIVDCGASGSEFAQAFREEEGTRPGFLDAQTYDAVFALALATLVAVEEHDVSRPRDVSPAQIRDAMRSINDPAGEVIVAGPDGFATAVAAVRDGRAINYAGASGPVDFDDLGNVIGNFVQYEVRDSRFEDVRLHDCLSDAECPITSDICEY